MLFAANRGTPCRFSKMNTDIPPIKEKIERWVDGQAATLVFATTTGLGVRSYLDFARRAPLKGYRGYSL